MRIHTAHQKKYLGSKNNFESLNSYIRVQHYL